MSRTPGEAKSSNMFKIALMHSVQALKNYCRVQFNDNLRKRLNNEEKILLFFFFITFVLLQNKIGGYSNTLMLLVVVLALGSSAHAEPTAPAQVAAAVAAATTGAGAADSTHIEAPISADVVNSSPTPTFYSPQSSPQPFSTAAVTESQSQVTQPDESYQKVSS